MVKWIYIHLLLTHLGFHISFIRWIMSCITTMSFVGLINGTTAHFFHAKRGLRQGCPLSPLIFPLVVEGLSHLLKIAKSEGNFKVLPISQVLYIMCLVFMDDILIFCDNTLRDVYFLRHGLDLFKITSRMIINEDKSSVMWENLESHEVWYMEAHFNFSVPSTRWGSQVLGIIFETKWLS